MARILVAEDEPSIREMLEQCLTAAGHVVTLTADGLTTLETVARLVPDVLLLDVALPRLDGIEVLKHVRQDPVTQPLWVVMMTSNPTDVERISGWVSSEIEYLIKPFAANELLAKLEWVFCNHGLAPQVLVVDDETAARRNVARALGEAGLRVRTAADGVDALECVAQRRPDLIVLDVMMPRLDGFEVLKHLKANPDTETIPLLILTALTAAAGEFRSGEFRVWRNSRDASLTKPYTLAELTRRVVQMLKGEAAAG